MQLNMDTGSCHLYDYMINIHFQKCDICHNQNHLKLP